MLLQALQPAHAQQGMQFTEFRARLSQQLQQENARLQLLLQQCNLKLLAQQQEVDRLMLQVQKQEQGPGTAVRAAAVSSTSTALGTNKPCRPSALSAAVGEGCSCTAEHASQQQLASDSSSSRFQYTCSRHEAISQSSLSLRLSQCACTNACGWA